LVSSLPKGIYLGKNYRQFAIQKLYDLVNLGPDGMEEAREHMRYIRGIVDQLAEEKITAENLAATGHIPAGPQPGNNIPEVHQALDTSTASIADRNLAAKILAYYDKTKS
jgi:hypothetical protein